ncbi:MAG TPA: hypothetical protein VHD81_08855 [Mycobacteriales bacterium]|nr:hypothetical protein [Mycobacteriales bacterium]
MSSLHEDASPQAQPHRIAIAVESEADHGVARAHAISPPMAELGRHGLTICGYPVDQLVIVPDLEWSEIDLAERCEHCALDPAI